MFIRKKANRYYLVENQRVNDRVRQKVIAYLGTATTIVEAIEQEEKAASKLRQQLAEDYDERTYTCFIRRWRDPSKQVERELQSYSVAYSRKYCPLALDGVYSPPIRDALAVIRVEKPDLASRTSAHRLHAASVSASEGKALRRFAAPTRSHQQNYSQSPACRRRGAQVVIGSYASR
jgi:hypothetical protein